jgi:ADP-L-glycero-D-manno-heptose 6-epimerase
MGKSPNIEYIDMPDSVRNQYQYFTQADITKLRYSGYENQITSLEEGVKDYVQNYLGKGTYIGG